MELKNLKDIGFNKCYISGPISGIENGNIDEFNRIEDEMKQRGFVSVNPHNITKGNKKIELLKSNLIGVESESKKAEIEKKIWIECMKVDIKEMMSCNFIVVLRNWETSSGANMELFIAQKLVMPIFDAYSLNSLNIVFDLRKFVKSDLL